MYTMQAVRLSSSVAISYSIVVIKHIHMYCTWGGHELPCAPVSLTVYWFKLMYTYYYALVVLKYNSST